MFSLNIMEVLPSADTAGPRRRPDEKLPQLRAIPPTPKPEMPTITVSPIDLTSQGRGKPLLAFGNPPLVPRGHLATLPYIG